MKAFLFGLLALLLTLIAIAIMCVAYCVVTPASWLETLREHIDRIRGLTITQVGDVEEAINDPQAPPCPHCNPKVDPHA